MALRPKEKLESSKQDEKGRKELTYVIPALLV